MLTVCSFFAWSCATLSEHVSASRDLSIRILSISGRSRCPILRTPLRETSEVHLQTATAIAPTRSCG